MPFWTILKIIHRHTSTRTLTTIKMTARTYMVNKEQNTIHKVADRNTYKNYQMGKDRQ